MMNGWMWQDGWGWGGWFLMAVLMVLFWAGVITAIVLAVRYLTGGNGQQRGDHGPTRDQAEDALAERYARGEIDDDEFRRRLTLLREHR